MNIEDFRSQLKNLLVNLNIEKINLATLAQSNLANHKNDAAIQATALQVFTKQLETLVTDNMLITEEAENKDQQN
jgi:hypothetical protein